MTLHTLIIMRWTLLLMPDQIWAFWHLSHSTRCHGGLDPGDEVAHFCVNPGLVSLSAALTPGHDSLQLSVTHQGPPRVTLWPKRWGCLSRKNVFWIQQSSWSPCLHYLTGVLSSLQVAGADHVFSNLERVWVKACVITQKRDLQALQLMRVPCC